MRVRIRRFGGLGAALIEAAGVRFRVDDPDAWEGEIIQKGLLRTVEDARGLLGRFLVVGDPD